MLLNSLKMAALGMLATLAAATLCGTLSSNALAFQAPPQARPCTNSGSGSGSLQSLPKVCGVSIRPGPDGAATIKVLTSSALAFHVLHLTHPSRLVVDFKGARNAAPRRAYPARLPLLFRVRIGQWRAADPAVVRVVADLKGAADSAIERRPWGVQVNLRPRAPHKVRQTQAEVARSRTRGGQSSGGAPAPRRREPKAEFPVHKFADLSASLTGPAVPSNDHLVRLGPNSNPPAASAAPATPATVYGVTIKPQSGGNTLVDIASSGPVPYRVFQLIHPARLVVDLKDARDASQRQVYPVRSSVLKRVRIGQWRSKAPSVVRIVADLEGSPLFDVHAQQPGLQIELRPRPAPGAPPRNPFRFLRAGPTVRVARPQDPGPQAPRTGSDPLLGLKVLGFVQKPGVGTEAILGDSLGVFVVPPGGEFENRFRLLQITPSAVQVEDMTSHERAWLQFTP